MYLLSLTYHLEAMFFFIVLNHYVWSIDLYFPCFFKNQFGLQSLREEGLLLILLLVLVEFYTIFLQFNIP